MATPLICLKISPENVKQLSVKTSSAQQSSVSVEGSLTVRWSKKYLSAKSPSLFGITVYREVMSMVKRNLLLSGKLNCFKMFSAVPPPPPGCFILTRQERTRIVRSIWDFMKWHWTDFGEKCQIIQKASWTITTTRIWPQLHNISRLGNLLRKSN